MDNCDIYGEVDFGEGPVRVRCTQTGVHETHVCIIHISDTSPAVIQSNVFERTND